MSNINRENKTEFGFQWHITNRCNLRCAHCYQEDYSGSNELGFDGLKQIADEIIRALTKWGKKFIIRLKDKNNEGEDFEMRG